MENQQLGNYDTKFKVRAISLGPEQFQNQLPIPSCWVSLPGATTNFLRVKRLSGNNTLAAGRNVDTRS